MNTYQRTLSETESQRLKGKLPWFGTRRQEMLADIEQRLIHVYEFDVLRSWDINGCRPPCCPYTYLFQTADDVYVYFETWGESDQNESENQLVIESTPRTRMLVKSTLPATIPLEHDEKLRELNEFFELSGAAEWRAWKKHEIPANVIELLHYQVLPQKS